MKTERVRGGGYKGITDIGGKMIMDCGVVGGQGGLWLEVNGSRSPLWAFTCTTRLPILCWIEYLASYTCILVAASSFRDFRLDLRGFGQPTGSD